MRILHRLLLVFIVLTVWFSSISPVLAVNTALKPCSETPAFQERKANAPEGYYFSKPFEAYSSQLVCGEEGLPHLPLQLDRTVDVIIPFALFFYVTGFIGWAGRAYLLAASKSAKPNEKEIFIDLSLLIQSLSKGLLWPVLAVTEFLNGELVADDTDVTVSPR